MGERWPGSIPGQTRYGGNPYLNLYGYTNRSRASLTLLKFDRFKVQTSSIKIFLPYTLAEAIRGYLQR